MSGPEQADYIAGKADDLAVGTLRCLHETSSGNVAGKFHVWAPLICGGITKRAVWIAQVFPHLCPILRADRFG